MKGSGILKQYVLRPLNEDYIIAYNRNDKSSTAIAKEMGLDKRKLLRIKSIGTKLINDTYYENNEALNQYEKAIEYYYQTSCSLEKIMKEFGIKDSIFKDKLINVFGLEPIDNKIKFDRNVFSAIDTEDKAYWLGFILADGGIYKNELRIKLGAIDKTHLEKFCELVSLDKSYIKKEIHQITGNELYKVVLHSSEIVSDLKNLGIDYNKTTREIPFYQISKELIPSYIRGFLDGDGYITKDFNTIGFVGSLEVLTFIKLELSKILELNNTKIIEHGKIFRLAYSSKKDKLQIAKLLYTNSKFHLDRKYNLAIKLIAVLDSNI